MTDEEKAQRVRLDAAREVGRMNPITIDEAKSIFTAAGFKVQAVWELPNRYWPSPTLDENSDEYERDQFLKYQSLRLAAPWFLVKTDYGLIEIGPRKRVLHIEWSDTREHFEITDKVTKGPHFCHAWSVLAAITYLSQLREHLVTRALLA